MTRSTRERLLTMLTLFLSFLMFFPILWMVLTSFKTEQVAFAFPPRLIFTPTLENWRIALVGTDYLNFLGNTLIITFVSTLAALILGVPAAYAMAFYATKRTDGSLLWVMSTRMLPPAGVIVPIYVIFQRLGLLDTFLGIIIIYTGMNVPLVIWMVRSFMLDIPFEIIEAARMDGVTLWQEISRMVLPLIVPGLAATALLCFIFAWNEFFFAFNLTTKTAAPLSVYISSFKTAEGLFWAKMSAAATATVFPVLIAGWVAQRQLVTGLTMGAVK
ncbi:MAG: carbohydrate ABC transporter permease [Caldilineaceae bacterium]|nr:carbohydrate ABC transporter permease [Caldilineaceae bacterium]MCB0143262.1 carbohydrate ABC transporter permease [Caldilineaceae bacterium]